MTEKTKRIEATHGPFAGQHIDVPESIAAEGISAGWARDPYGAAAEPKSYDETAYAEMLAAADRAARAIRGEDEPQPKPAPKAKPAKEETREARPDTETSGTYKTRGPGRPSKE